MWGFGTGMDPLTEKYTEISGYVYCHANPVILFDPDGMDDYQMDEKGNLSFWRRTNAKTTDRIYAGKHSITINKTIRKQLMTDRDDYNGHYAVGGKEMVDIYSFMANNSKAEWALNGYNTRKGKQYVISTSHSDESVTYRPAIAGMKETNLFVRVHSHTDGNSIPSGFRKNDIYISRDGKQITGISCDRLTVNDVYVNILKDGKTVFPKFFVYDVKNQNLVKFDPDKVGKKVKVVNKKLNL